MEGNNMDGLEILFAIQEAQSWDQWSQHSRVVALDGIGSAKKIAEYDGGFDSEGYGYGPQGWEGESWFVLEVLFSDNSKRYFKKFGTVDSYGYGRWGGKCIEVFPKKVEAVVYE